MRGCNNWASNDPDHGCLQEKFLNFCDQAIALKTLSRKDLSESDDLSGMICRSSF